MVIGNFVKQYPQFEKLFQNQMALYQQKEYQKYRSKSTDFQFQSNQQPGGKALFHNHTQKNLGIIPIQNKVVQLDSMRKEDPHPPYNYQRNNNFPQSGQANQPQPAKRSNNQYPVASKLSKRS